MKHLETPFEDLLPPLATAERDALMLSIAEHGIQVPIVADARNRVIDGHNRYAIALKLGIDPPVRIDATIQSDIQAQAAVYQANFARRNLSPDQKTELRAAMRDMAKALREEDPKRWTQAAIAARLGVARETVRNWFDTSNGQSANACKPDARMKVPEAEAAAIPDRIDAGDTQAQIAADLGITQQRVSQIEKKTRKQRKKEAARQSSIKTVSDFSGIQVGDFRVISASIPDNSIDLIFIDPPYDRKALPLYEDAARIGARILKPGGSLVCYTGQILLPDALMCMRDHLRYWWTGAVVHEKKSHRMREYGVIVGWKPLMWFVKETRANKRQFLLDTVTGGLEKCTHPWQQSVGEASHFIDALCPADGVVVDFFVGGATTLVAANNLSRRWVGFEIDKATAAAASQRLENER